MKNLTLFLSFFFLWGCGPKDSSLEKKPKQSEENNINYSEKPSKNDANQTKNVIQVGPNVYLEVDGSKRMVVVSSKVVRREGLLELLLCREKTKEHESILAASVDAKDMHQAMLIAGMKTGTPVQFLPDYKPAKGVPLDIKLRYKDPKGIEQTNSAREWIRKSMTTIPLEANWVFAGSKLIPNSIDSKAPPYFLANDGDLISISNFESALIDVSIKISSSNADLGYEPFTEKIPPVGTPVAILISESNKMP